MKKVAVVAVHGVADQKPAESARAIADLLNPWCGPFTEVPLRIARNKVHTNVKPADPGMAYMHDQLKGYESNDAGSVYDTARLDGVHKSNGDDVHVFEVYWADLSRAGDTAVRLFGELYQLLLHLPSLGRNAVKAAMEENKHPLWKIAYGLQAAAVALFTVVIPLLNVAMISLALVAVSAEVPKGAQSWLAAALVALALGATAIYALRGVVLPKFVWYVLPFACSAVGWFAHTRVASQAQLALAIEAAVIAALITIAIGISYSKMKKHAIWFAPLAAVACSGTAIVFLRKEVTAETERTTYSAALHAVEVILVPLNYIWIAVIVLLLLAAVAGLVAATFGSKRRVDGHRVAWTARFSLALPVALFSTLTIAIWLLLTQVISAVAPDKPYTPLQDSDLIGAGWLKDHLLTPPALPEDWTLQNFMHRLVVFRAVFFPLFAGSLTLFLLAAAWVAGPSILYEISHPKDVGRRSEAVGKWISNGFHLVAGAADLVTLTFLAVVIIRAIRPNYAPVPLEIVDPLLYVAAAVLAALLTTKNFIGPLRSAIDIVLDVDNYMREHPDDATPRARIAERFVSLLRHLAAEQYDRVVIVAHSQGTVIAADTLRFIKAVPDPTLTNLTSDLRLFTMGSPLRQLYAAAFPNFYDWIEKPPLLPPPPAPLPLPPNAPPLPASIGVSRWSNVYRSGDYVGRYLWLDEKYPRLWVRLAAAPPNPPVPDLHQEGPPPPSARTQFCAGAGAHTHYWNKHGADVAWHLEQLI